MAINRVLFGLLWFGFHFSFCQSPSIRFLNHLEQNGDFKEGLLFLDQFGGDLSADSVAFYKGKFHYELKQLQSSIAAFGSIPDQHPMGSYARFYEGLQLTYLNSLQEADRAFLRVSVTTQSIRQLQILALAGTSLLTRDFVRFDSLAGRFDRASYLFAENQQAFEALALDIRQHKTKSPFVAGLLSAFVPGAGKYYNGQVGAGTMALVTTGIFGLQTWESYRKVGPKSARFLIFGTAFALFYTANIWGSVVSVGIEEKTYQQQIDETILVNMHIPIRLLFK